MADAQDFAVNVVSLITSGDMVRAIREVREALPLGLKEAKDLVDSRPSVEELAQRYSAAKHGGGIPSTALPQVSGATPAPSSTLASEDDDEARGIEPLRTLSSEPLRRWHEWATAHDDLLAKYGLATSLLDLDASGLTAAIERTRADVKWGSNHASKRIVRAHKDVMKTQVGATGPTPAPWPPGELPTIVDQIMRNFSSALDTYRRSAGEAASLSLLAGPGAVIENEVKPALRKMLSLRESLRRLEKVMKELAASVHDEYTLAIRAHTRSYCEELVASEQRYRDELAMLPPTGRPFDDPSWNSWSPTDTVRQVLAWYQTLPFAAVANAADASDTSTTDFTPAVVFDFRFQQGFSWYQYSNPPAGLQQSSAEAATRAAQALVLRLMAAVPPGKARFTFIDPLGSGRNVAPFLELAEWDPILIDSKAWCQQREITAKLEELNAHLELVTQKYLKGQFETIEEYNREAGEVAEPYRFVVIFDFPSQFDESSLHLLTRLTQNGPRCGVFVLAVWTAAATVPHGVNPMAALRGLVQMPVRTDLAHNRWVLGEPALSGLRKELLTSKAAFPGWTHEMAMRADDERRSAFRRWLSTPDAAWPLADQAPPLKFDRDAPSPSLFTRVISAVGEAGRGANDVVVSAQRVWSLVDGALRAGARSDLPAISRAPNPDDKASWWGATATDGLSVPIGRAGARDPAMFAVDTAILSGAFIIGRPGSGKSTLMHSLICSAAMLYSPSELEMHLLDFKQGVEFLSYGELGLPHAKCVAVESEREFGVAVLESLVAELEQRAQSFKGAGPGITNISQFRRHTGEPMPRILIVIDEFHVLFERSDRLASRAEQQLDHLIRQGRAFGIHVVLGSQSLATTGSATPVTSMLRLLPIRIVLPSDSSDAVIALGEKNDAAQFLTRQGEGIYNDAGGNPEHNVRFQGTLLTDTERHHVIETARALADSTGDRRRPRVFNGHSQANMPADPGEFARQVAEGSPTRTRVPLGTPLTLDPDLFIELPRDSAANLIVISKQHELVDGFGSAVTSALSVQAVARSGTVHFVDCRPLDAETDNWVEPLMSSGVIRTHRPRALEELLGELKELISSRIDNDDVGQPPIYSIIWGLHRARELDASGSLGYVDPSEPSPAKDFQWVLRNGPEVGVHTIAWIDSVPSLNRAIAYTSVRDFNWRVAGQLNETDSDSLGLEAARLKPSQLACLDVDTGKAWRVVAFRRPTDEWLTKLSRSI